MRAIASRFAIRWILVTLSIVGCQRPAKPPLARVGEIALLSAYAHPSAGDAGAIYVQLRNDGTAPDTLASVTGPDSAAAMLMSTNAGRMQMLASVELPPGGVVAMIPGGTHVMFSGLTREYAIGDTLPVTLHFSRAGALAVKAVVLPFGEIPE